MRRSKRKLYRSLRRNDTDIPLRIQNFKDARYDYKQFITKVKEDEWRDFVKDSSENNPWSQAYKICRGRKKKPAVYRSSKMAILSSLTGVNVLENS